MENRKTDLKSKGEEGLYRKVEIVEQRATFKRDRNSFEALISETHEKKSKVYIEERNPPNYFLATRITKPSIVNRVHDLQKHLRQELPFLKMKDFTKPNKLHMTYFVMVVKDNDMLQKVLDTLEESKQIVAKYFKNKEESMSLKYVKNFNHRVVWMDIEETIVRNKLSQCVAEIKEHMRISVPGLELEEKVFKPHITLLKMRNSKMKVTPEYYKEYSLEDFGLQTLNPFELVAMHEHDEEGYYKCYGRLHLDGRFEK